MGKTLIINGADFSNVALEKETVFMNTDNMEKHACSLGGSGTWYGKNASGVTLNSNHVIFDVEGRKEIQLKLVSSESPTAFYAFLTASHSEPVAHGQTINYCSGCDRVSVDSGNAGMTLSVEVPNDAKYIVFVTVDGASKSVSWEFSVE